MKNLDFLIIGAQKCATTTLFEQLRAHPDIAMPLEKEVPFFNSPNATEEEWQSFSDQHFGEADGRLWGKATPQYLSDPYAARRIATLMPEVKLVVILRDPIERSWSHYRMDRRRGTEQRPFDEVIRGLLEPETAQNNRYLPIPRHEQGFESESAFHVAWSEYGRALAPYTAQFPKEQLLVLYLEDLASKPEETLDRLLAFLDLETGFRPPALGKVVHAGGSKNRIPHGARVWLRERALVRHLWQAMPDDRKGRLRFLYERWNGAGSTNDETPGLPQDLHAELVAHFASDLRQLLARGITPPPWVQRYVAASGAAY
ncbi:MAG: sulfotransferase [Xanthomonadales bacterium]|nr:sulfotransferase [Xanthomonadales bacterium]